MPITSDAAEKMIPKQRGWLAKLAVTCDRAIRKIRYKTGDDFGLMALCHLSKQIDHARSVNRLIGDPPSRDAAVIARSMLEGAVFLDWASRSKEDRGGQWQEYAAVEEWRRLNDADEVGLPVSRKERREIRAAVAAHGPRFLTSGAKKKRARGGTLPADPYWKTWVGDQIGFKKVLSETESEELRVLYAKMSGSVHWGPGGFANYLIRQSDSTIQYQSVSLPDAASAAGVAVLSLLQTASIVADHFGLNEFLTGLRRDHDDYDKWHALEVSRDQ